MHPLPPSIGSATMRRAMIQAHGIELAFEGGPLVLRGVDLSLERGALVGLIGPPSSGKSVLLKVLAGLLRPQRGEVRVDGLDLASAADSALRSARKGIGMVFQNNALFDSLTVFDNVAFPLRRADQPPDEEEISRRVLARLAEVGLQGAGALFPHELSGGMQKRAGIARATVAAPRVRLFDDPTAGLDPVTSARILALITAIHGADPGGVTVVVSNEMDPLLAAVPRLLMLRDGALIFDDRVDALGRAPEVAAFVRGEGEEARA